MEVPARDKMERDLARQLSKLFGIQLGKLLELMGDPPRMENVPASFWEEGGAAMAKTMLPFTTSIFLAQAKKLMAQIPTRVDWSLVNTRAVEYARKYVYNLVKDITDTSRQRTSDAIARFFEDGLTREELEGLLFKDFGPVRAEMIAVTEVTRSAARGEDAIWDELHEQGIDMETSWNTLNDELVCEICGPLHGTIADGRDDEGPYWETDYGPVHCPAHPRCRCNENNLLPE
jgi:hypothetical protein